MRRWLLLTYQIPSEPSNLRVKVWRKLQTLGAIPIKNSIYVLPTRAETREDFEWLRKEIEQLGGRASVFLADSISEMDDRDILEAFQSARAKEIDEFLDRAHSFKERLQNLLRGAHVKEEAFERINRDWLSFRKELERLEKIDFFSSPKLKAAKLSAASVEKVFQQAKTISLTESPPLPEKVDVKNLKGKVWVTRKSPHIDRLGCAWLIRRFIDPKARFKFVSEPYKPTSKSEIRFDMSDGEFTHHGDWCSFETFIQRLSLQDAALQEIAEIVHDIDLKDEKFDRNEAPGLSALVRGLAKITPDDFKRVEKGVELFDAAYAWFNDKLKIKK